MSLTSNTSQATPPGTTNGGAAPPECDRGAGGRAPMAGVRRPRRCANELGRRRKEVSSEKRPWNGFLLQNSSII